MRVRWITIDDDRDLYHIIKNNPRYGTDGLVIAEVHANHQSGFLVTLSRNGELLRIADEQSRDPNKLYDACKVRPSVVHMNWVYLRPTEVQPKTAPEHAETRKVR